MGGRVYHSIRNALQRDQVVLVLDATQELHIMDASTDTVSYTGEDQGIWGLGFRDEHVEFRLRGLEFGDLFSY